MTLAKQLRDLDELVAARAASSLADRDATAASSGKTAKAKTSQTLRAKRRREERTAMGGPASNLPSSGGNKKAKARSSSFGISMPFWGGPSRVGRVVRKPSRLMDHYHCHGG